MYKATARILFTDASTADVDNRPAQHTWGAAYDDMSRQLSRVVKRDDDVGVDRLIIRINKVS